MSASLLKLPASSNSPMNGPCNGQSGLNGNDRLSHSKLALKGSCKTVTDYFEFAIHSILFQRGIYPAEDFMTVRKYALPLLWLANEEVVSYVGAIMTQIRRWIYAKRILKLALVIVAKLSCEIVERWEFSINVNAIQDNDDTIGALPARETIQGEIQAIIRQITASAAFLPVLSDVDGEGHTFNVLVHTDQDASAPCEWIDIQEDDRKIQGQHEQVDFSSLNTNIHQIGTQVSYKVME